MTRGLKRVLYVLAVLSASTTLTATTARQLSNEELATVSQIIAIGRCTGLKAVWEGRTLVTVATVAVAETLKGEAGATLEVALPGGIDAARKFPVSVTWPGAPTMRVGEEVFLFLVAAEGIASGATVAGFSQGKFSIGRDGAGRKFVTRDLTAVTLQSGTGVARGTRTHTPLDEFKAEILGYLK